jgi:two-component system, LytTR family, response regulator
MITCFAIDDEPHALKQVEGYVKQVSFMKWLGSTTRPMAAMTLIARLKPQLIFLDIYMPGLNGLELLREINAQTDARVILTTGNDRHGAEGYDQDVIDYLLKPYDLPRFLRAANKAYTLLYPKLAGQMAPAGKIILKFGGKHTTRHIELAQIDFVEGNRNYVHVNCNGENIMTAETLKNMEELLPGEFFIRVHKSYIVAYKKVKQVQGESLVMYNDICIPIGKIYKEAFYHLMGLKEEE